MEGERYQKSILIFYLVILTLNIIFLFLNLDSISVIHAKESEMIPVLKYETYTSLEISLLYVLFLLNSINIFLIWSKKFEKYSTQIISLTPIIALILILLFILNPHSIILSPSGFPPTSLDYLNLGGHIIISLYTAFILISLLYIYSERNLLKYLIFIAIIIGALLFSDFIHESGHAVLVLLSGGHVNEFYPFPVLLGGEFAGGYVGYSNVPTDLVPLVLLGGEIFQWITIAILGIIFWRIKPTGKLRLFLVVVLLISWLDFPLYTINNSIGIPHWFLIGSVQGDIISFSNITGFPLSVLIIFACIQLIIGILIIWKTNFWRGIKNRKERTF